MYLIENQCGSSEPLVKIFRVIANANINNNQFNLDITSLKSHPFIQKLLYMK
jgi:hypothetical protein